VLETDDALVILDELHAIIHKNHKIGELCKKHELIGLCYRLSEFYRQVRKRNINTRQTCQTFQDAHYQFRTLMQQQILCEKYHLEGTKLKKCDSLDGKCPDDHNIILSKNYIGISILLRNYLYLIPNHIINIMIHMKSSADG